MSAPEDIEGHEPDPAAEYALGVLDGGERRAVERRMRHDPKFAREVRNWDRRLAPLSRLVPAAEPPKGFWQRVEAELDQLTRDPHRIPTPVYDGGPANAVSAFWRWLALGASGVAAAALVLLAVFATAPDGEAPLDPALQLPTVLAATLASEDANPIYTAYVDLEAMTATMVPLTRQDAGGVHELWLIGESGTPASLGILGSDGPMRIDLSGRADEEITGTLAVSLEPEGGSPTGQPTGPVIASGDLAGIGS